MFEFDKYEKQLHEDRELAPQSSYEAVRDIEQMSLLMWGEHCVECAAPSCFTSCDLYQRRPDTRCRRLTYGMYRNPRFPSVRGYGAEVTFKKWGKIEARGNTLLLPSDVTLWTERMVGLSAPLLNAFGAFVHRLTRDGRWSYLEHSLLERLGRWLHRKNDPNSRQQPDLFLLEVYNPMNVPVRMQLS